MFCRSCGKNLPDGAVFCDSCGTKVVSENTQTYSQPPQNQFNNQGNFNYQTPYPQVPGKKPNIAVIIGSVAAALAVIILAVVLLTSGGGYEKPISYIVKYMHTGDVNTAFKALPKDMRDKILKLYDLSDLQEDADNSIKFLKETYGSNYKITYKVVDKTKMDADEIKEAQEFAKKYIGENITIKEGYKLECELSIKGSKGSRTNAETINVYKIGSNWYLLDTSFM